MPYGCVGFEQVWKFQIECMMSHQFVPLVKAISKGSRDEVIVSCLRLGWNDAFKHVSENTARYKKDLSNKDKESEVNEACVKLVEYFERYAMETNYTDRYTNLDRLIKSSMFVDIFKDIKEVSSKNYPLCLGHIQKMFNIAMKVLLCLIVSAEHASSLGLMVKLGEVGTRPVHLTDHDLLSYTNFPYSFDTADCPIDHIILECIEDKKTPVHSKIHDHSKYSQIVWSKLGAKEDPENYLSAQKEIENIQLGSGKSNLYFDLENW